MLKCVCKDCPSLVEAEHFWQGKDVVPDGEWCCDQVGDIPIKDIEVCYEWGDLALTETRCKAACPFTDNELNIPLCELGKRCPL